MTDMLKSLPKTVRHICGCSSCKSKYKNLTQSTFTLVPGKACSRREKKHYVKLLACENNAVLVGDGLVDPSLCNTFASCTEGTTPNSRWLNHNLKLLTCINEVVQVGEGLAGQSFPRKLPVRDSGTPGTNRDLDD